ncbi:MAG: beta-propeller fold lactonase family protein [Acidobacteria bacterium]|nr:beta-propeller fold lactonase family protein [Acidobacteriota bacterium]
MSGRKGIPALLFLALLSPVFCRTEETYKIKKIGKSPNFIALSPDGKRMYATSFGTDELIGIDLTERIVDRNIGVGASPLGFALAEQGRIALVACKDAGVVTLVDLDSWNVVGDINVGGYPNSVTVGPRGYRAFVTDYGRSREGRLHIIDIRERRVAATMKMGAVPFTTAVSPVTELVWTIMGGDNEVWVVDPERLVVVGKIPVGEAPDGIAITPDGRRVFVSNSRSNDLSVIDAQMMRLVVTIPVGEMPFGVAVSPDGNRVFVVNSASRTVSVLPTDLSSLKAQTFKVDKGPTNVVVGPDNRTVYVVNELSNSIVVTDVPPGGSRD